MILYVLLNLATEIIDSAEIGYRGFYQVQLFSQRAEADLEQGC